MNVSPFGGPILYTFKIFKCTPYKHLSYQPHSHHPTDLSQKSLKASWCSWLHGLPAVERFASSCVDHNSIKTLIFKGGLPSFNHRIFICWHGMFQDFHPENRRGHQDTRIFQHLSIHFLCFWCFWWASALPDQSTDLALSTPWRPMRSMSE